MNHKEMLKKWMEFHGWGEIPSALSKEYEGIEDILFFRRGNITQVMVIVKYSFNKLKLSVEFIRDYIPSWENIYIIIPKDGDLYTLSLDNIIYSQRHSIDIDLCDSNLKFRLLPKEPSINHIKNFLRIQGYTINDTINNIENMICLKLKKDTTNWRENPNYIAFIKTNHTSDFVKYKAAFLQKLLKEYTTTHILLFINYNNIWFYHNLDSLLKNRSLFYNETEFLINTFIEVKPINRNVIRIIDYFEKQNWKYQAYIKDEVSERVIFTKDKEFIYVYITSSNSTNFSISKNLIQNTIIPDEEFLYAYWIVQYNDNLYCIKFNDLITQCTNQYKYEGNNLIADSNIFTKL